MTGKIISFFDLNCKQIIFLLFISVYALNVCGQTREDLERERQKIREEMNLTNQLLEETKKSAETNLNQLVILNNQIDQREELLRNISNKISFTNRQIDNHEQEIEKLNNELEELRESYAEMIRYAYKNRDAYHRLMFLFSAQDFNQAYMRMRYMQQYAHHRKLQAKKIKEATEMLDQQVADLEERKNEQQELLVEHREEIHKLTIEKEEQSKTVEVLRRKEQDLMDQLQHQEQEAEQLSEAIQKIIEEERKRAAKKAKAEGRATPTKAFELTPEEEIISDKFYENKGNLPWPSERGIITRTFGEQDHPVLPGIRVSNDGINISTTEGAKARAVFEGIVVRVFSVPSGDNAVIVRHGEFLTVYSNLSEVIVSNGQRVDTRQEIGVVSTDPRDRKTELHLQVWRGNEKLNPAEWIARR